MNSRIALLISTLSFLFFLPCFPISGQETDSRSGEPVPNRQVRKLVEKLSLKGLKTRKKAQNKLRNMATRRPDVTRTLWQIRASHDNPEVRKRLSDLISHARRRHYAHDRDDRNPFLHTVPVPEAEEHRNELRKRLRQLDVLKNHSWSDLFSKQKTGERPGPELQRFGNRVPLLNALMVSGVQLEDLLSGKNTINLPTGPDRKYIFLPGGSFSVGLRSWNSDRRTGVVVETAYLNDRHLTGGDERTAPYHHWRIASVNRKKKSRPPERCNRHSPEQVFLPGADTGDFIEVTIAGEARMLRKKKVVFENPENGQVKRKNKTTVTLSWPFVELKTSPTPFDLRNRILKREDVSVTWKSCHEDHQLKYTSIGPGADSGYCGFGSPHETWCGCNRKNPIPYADPEMDLSRTKTVTLSLSDERGKKMLDHMDTITVEFYEPVRIPFRKTIRFNTLEKYIPEKSRIKQKPRDA